MKLKRITAALLIAAAALTLVSCADKGSGGLPEGGLVSGDTGQMSLESDAMSALAETSASAETTTAAATESTTAVTKEAITAAATESTTAVTKEATTAAATETTTAATTKATTAATTEATTAATTEATTAEPEPEGEQNGILLFYTYDNVAWGLTQTVIAFGADGKYYKFTYDFYYSEEDDDEPEDGRVRYWDDNWYCEVTGKVMTEENRYTKKIPYDDLKSMTEKLPEYENPPMRNYEAGYSDYGYQDIYGVYTDENGKAHKVKLAFFGDDGGGCLDSADVREFVNKLLTDRYFYFDGLYFGGDGEFHEIRKE